jgi:hypothetical protein
MANKECSSGRKPDKIAEIAQMIAEADQRRERTAADSRFRREFASECQDEVPLLAPMSQFSADLNVPQQAHEFDEYCHDASHEHYQTEVPNARRRGLALIIAMTGLALLGTAGVIGYRAMSGGSVIMTSPPIVTASDEPNKVAQVSGPPQAKSGDNARQDGAGTTGSIEKLVSREEQPMTIVQPKGATSRVGVPSTPTPTIAGEPIPNQTRPQFGAAADPAVPAPNAAMSQRGGVGELNRAPLAAIPTTPTKANGAAVVTSPVLGSDYAVQLTSERSESGAQAAFLALQAKYPNQLRGRQATIRRADLGAGGIYYRALVGPFVSSEKAAKLCRGLKAAGGDCVILKN